MKEQEIPFIKNNFIKKDDVYIAKNNFFITTYYIDFKTHLLFSKGFKTDFCSAPGVIKNKLMPSLLLYHDEWLIHDFLYTHNKINVKMLQLKKTLNLTLTRKQIDLKLRSDLRKKKMSKFKSNLVYFFVRVFGKRHFLKDTENKKYISSAANIQTAVSHL